MFDLNKPIKIYEGQMYVVNTPPLDEYTELFFKFYQKNEGNKESSTVSVLREGDSKFDNCVVLALNSFEYHPAINYLDTSETPYIEVKIVAECSDSFLELENEPNEPMLLFSSLVPVYEEVSNSIKDILES